MQTGRTCEYRTRRSRHVPGPQSSAQLDCPSAQTCVGSLCSYCQLRAQLRDAWQQVPMHVLQLPPRHKHVAARSLHSSRQKARRGCRYLAAGTWQQARVTRTPGAPAWVPRSCLYPHQCIRHVTHVCRALLPSAKDLNARSSGRRVTRCDL